MRGSVFLPSDRYSRDRMEVSFPSKESMQQSSLHKVKLLSPPVRSALEQLLGRTLGENEEISIRTYHPHEGPSVEQQREVADQLRAYFARIDEKSRNVPLSEQEEAVEEAIRSVRPGYRSIR